MALYIAINNTAMKGHFEKLPIDLKLSVIEMTVLDNHKKMVKEIKFKKGKHDSISYQHRELVDLYKQVSMIEVENLYLETTTMFWKKKLINAVVAIDPIQEGSSFKEISSTNLFKSIVKNNIMHLDLLHCIIEHNKDIMDNNNEKIELNKLININLNSHRKLVNQYPVSERVNFVE